MLVQRRVMTWRRVGKSLHALVAHGLLFSFTILLVLKLHRAVRCPWWIVFSPLWLFHAVVARGRFSLPAPALPHDRNVRELSPSYVGYTILLARENAF
ncbi:hypothetical protein L484_022961 [Morus notabilis]|uniref:Uncharacterized protein n=1 Tax=Morus notabilis TaxID=981085 RepID=W9QTH5_9ROSA|nr:hypothetical protein L484_022961 [Morus notabilis]